jgi:hypothetical protein
VGVEAGAAGRVLGAVVGRAAEVAAAGDVMCVGTTGLGVGLGTACAGTGAGADEEAAVGALLEGGEGLRAGAGSEERGGCSVVLDAELGRVVWSRYRREGAARAEVGVTALMLSAETVLLLVRLLAEPGVLHTNNTIRNAVIIHTQNSLRDENMYNNLRLGDGDSLSAGGLRRCNDGCRLGNGRVPGLCVGRADDPGGERPLALAPLDLRRVHTVHVGLPHHDHLVGATGGEEVTVGAEARRVDGAGVALKGKKQPTLAQVPNFHGGVFGRGHHVVPGLCTDRVNETKASIITVKCWKLVSTAPVRLNETVEEH